jgi:hypothetical protein
LERAGGGIEKDGQRSGTLPAPRQQGMRILISLEIDAEWRDRSGRSLPRSDDRRIIGLFAVADDVNNARRCSCALFGLLTHYGPSCESWLPRASVII